MGSAAQTRAVANYRKRLSKQGMARFEVVGLERDRDLIRVLARKLAENGPESMRIRTSVETQVGSGSNRKGGILAMLQSAPVLASELNFARKRTTPRKVEL